VGKVVFALSLLIPELKEVPWANFVSKPMCHHFVLRAPSRKEEARLFLGLGGGGTLDTLSSALRTMK
jgi:hypothetical protein